MDREMTNWEENIKQEIEERGTKAKTTGVWIREYLRSGIKDYLSSMHRKYKEFIRDETSKDALNYQSFARYARELRGHDLIKEVDSEPAKHEFLADRKYYQAVEDKLDDPRWERPFKYSRED